MDTYYIDQKLSDNTMQNRDILKWVDRIERSKKFTDTAQLFIDDVGTAITTDALNLFKSIWTTVYEEQCSPRGLVVSASIMHPYMKKILPEGETYFSSIKEYPFYYVLHLNTSFMMNAATEKMSINHEYFAEWYSNNMSGIFESQLTTRLKATISKHFSDNIIAFPTNKEKFEEGKINIILSSSLDVSKEMDKFHKKTSAANFTVKNAQKKTFAVSMVPNNDILVSTLSMALSRLLAVNEVNIIEP